jgi:regulation of enolase protein 1 (concanavalin A-like superfamily)
MIKRRCLGLVMLALAATSLSAQETLPLPAVAAIKDATVMIVTSSGTDTLTGGSGSGSGFLFRVDGQTGYVATNQHVVRPRGGPSGAALTITVVLRSGAQNEQKVRGEVVASSSQPDLAIIKINDVRDPPAPIDILKETEPVETMPVHVFGFPFGDSLALGRGSPSVVVGKGSISSVRRDSLGKISTVLIDGALNPGNSGGPIIDTQGRLVGVAVAAIRGANIGIAIPRRDLLELLAGHPTGFSITAINHRQTMVDLTVRVPLFDPFDNIKEVTLLYNLTGSVLVKSNPHGPQTTWAPLPGASQTKLKIQAHQAEGTIAIVPPPGKGVELVYQFAYAGERGQTNFTRPGRYLFGTRRVTSSKAAAFLPLYPWGDVVDPDGDCKVVPENGRLNFEVPGSLHDLNAEIGKLNAPRVVQDIEGDFVVQVKVCGELQPGGPGTRHDAFPYNGAGLVVWLDGDHYIRMERGAVLRNSRVGALLLCQKHEGDGPLLRKNAFLEEGDVYLKLERRGRHIAGFYSTDGQQWAETSPIEVDWPARLKVGLSAVNSAFTPLSIRFEEFSVRNPTSDGLE